MFFVRARCPDGKPFVVWARPTGVIGERDRTAGDLFRNIVWQLVFRGQWTVSVLPDHIQGFRRSLWKERQPSRVDAKYRTETLQGLICAGDWQPELGPPPR